MRQSLNTTEHVFYTVKNAKEVVVFDADLQKDKRGDTLLLRFLNRAALKSSCLSQCPND